MLYISGRRNTDRIGAITTLKVFANTSSVTLYLNGKKVNQAETGTTKHDLVLKNINPVKGVNQLRAEGYFNGKLQIDSIEWTLKK
ncbi:hypothetical protein [Mucilaginibacter sp. OK268]|uniref:hypothetical protein n=1 Tax=Mucilaginibacter sp. OK268 TaxID=1881048 RepID=UPI000B86DB38|nr:hypothetical protein [Mucilaginibacter sp. OK268]